MQGNALILPCTTPLVPACAHAFHAHRTLLLNADYKPFTYPLEPLNAEDTIRGLFLGRYKVVEWSNTYAHSPSCEFRLPAVVAVKDYVPDAGLYGIPACNLPNLFVRDIGLCQYTGEELRLNSPNPSMQATIDHLHPKSRGGKIEWTNVVLASQSANNRKGNLTLAQSGLKLRTQPWVPRGADLLYLWLTQNRLDMLPPTWHEFLQIKPTPALRRVLEGLDHAA
ncbi:MAG: HNH endonuclease [Alphaproteobacteria bacterium]|nr:MAG: HNH endonuclease [Alphaproteobacteria bacterium]